jgi:hypothetical protein
VATVRPASREASFTAVAIAPAVAIPALAALVVVNRQISSIRLDDGTDDGSGKFKGGFRRLLIYIIGLPSQALQIIFEVEKQKTCQKRAVKKIHFLELQKVFFSIFFILTPPTFKLHNFVISYSF